MTFIKYLQNLDQFTFVCSYNGSSCLTQRFDFDGEQKYGDWLYATKECGYDIPII